VFDTTRTISQPAADRCRRAIPDIKFIWSHGGGTVPYITSRLNGAGGDKLPKGVMYELQKFYYDTAQAFKSVHHAVVQEVRADVPDSLRHDFPLGGGSAAIVAKGLKDNGGFTETELRAVERENALRLLPRLKTLNRQPRRGLLLYSFPPFSTCVQSR
jgi:predicted TIM-barrel fold metal-dependent hydrolase